MEAIFNNDLFPIEPVLFCVIEGPFEQCVWGRRIAVKKKPHTQFNRAAKKLGQKPGNMHFRHGRWLGGIETVTLLAQPTSQDCCGEKRIHMNTALS